MTETNVFQLAQPGTFAASLTDVLREGARALLAQAVEVTSAATIKKITIVGSQRSTNRRHRPRRVLARGRSSTDSKYAFIPCSPPLRPNKNDLRQVSSASGHALADIPQMAAGCNGDLPYLSFSGKLEPFRWVCLSEIKSAHIGDAIRLGLDGRICAQPSRSRDTRRQAANRPSFGTSLSSRRV